jgi:hypothetical protein
MKSHPLGRPQDKPGSRQDTQGTMAQRHKNILKVSSGKSPEQTGNYPANNNESLGCPRDVTKCWPEVVRTLCHGFV